MSINNLLEKIVAFNLELNTVEALITEQTAGQLFFKRLIAQRKALDVATKAIEAGTHDSTLLEKFSEHNEQMLTLPPDYDAEGILNAKPNSTEFFVDKAEFVEEVAKIYAGEIEGTSNEIPQDKQTIQTPASNPPTMEAPKSKEESFSLSIVLNDKQLHAKEMALSGKNYALIGAAGTGKTTTQRCVAETLLQDSKLDVSTFKSYDKHGARIYVSAPSIAFVAYTRRAASNLRRAIHKSPELEEALQHNIMTIHSLLEYEPETYFDPIEAKDKFRFSPRRTAQNPLNITHLVIEEASMVGVSDLWPKLYDALPVGVQIIFIGDINQLPPVFGPSVLNYALVQLPVVELTHVYRNQGIVLDNAHNILAGRPIVEDANYRIVRGKKNVEHGQEKTSYMLKKLFADLSTIKDADGELEYDPEECIILSPWNKQELGTDNMNKHIAQFLGERRKAIVHEVLAGRFKVYLALGDKVMFNKRDGVISKIERNSSYFGKEPQLPGVDLSRFGVRKLMAETSSLDDISIDYSNFSLEALEDEKAERKQQASHTITIKYEDETEDELSATGDFGSQVFSLGYVLTVHKAQGSEWRKVFIILHKDFAVSLYRELFYTAATRARRKVTIIANDVVIGKAIKNQRIKGDTLADKLEYFNSGADLRDNVYTSKI